MTRYLIGNLLDGRKIQWLSPSTGSWSEVLNDSGEVSCVVNLDDPGNRRLALRESATVAKAYLAAVDGDTVLQAGPIWDHDWDDDSSKLTLRAAGMWSYFDHRALLPVLAGRLPTDPTTDTRFSNVVSDEDDPGYPWESDTRQSLLTIAKKLVEQAQTWTNGDVPVVLPDETVGASERWYKGTDLATVGDRLRQLTAVDDGPDIMFTPRWQVDKLGIEWVMRVGDPLLASPQKQTFNMGTKESSVSRLRVKVNGVQLASNGYASGGKTVGQAVYAVSEDSTLTDAGYPLLDAVDATHTTAVEDATVQGYADELTLRGRAPVEVWTFSHDSSRRPFTGAYNAGDYAKVRVRGNAYIGRGDYPMRVLTRAGVLEHSRVTLQFGPVL